jgi:hypothetical protein
MRRFVAAAAIVSTSALTGCSGGSTAIGLPGASGGNGSSTCNDVTLLGSSFDVHSTQAAVPAPRGGTIADGTWVGTKVELWGSSEPEGSTVGKAGGITWEVKNAMIQSVAKGASSEIITRRTLIIATDAESFTFTSSCDDPPGDGGVGIAQTGTYTAMPTTLSLYVQSSGTSTLELMFTKQ